MNPRDKMTLNPAPITNPGKPLRRQIVAPSLRPSKRTKAMAVRQARRFRGAHLGRAAHIGAVLRPTA